MPDKPTILVFAYHNVGHEGLDVLIKRRDNIIAVITHEDNPNEDIWFRSAAALAKQNNIPVYTPESVSIPEWISRIREWNPELIFSFYYRNMIKEKILNVPRLGAFNMHGSLLPKYRGRAPVNWAVLNGERETGATLHVMVKRPDAGDIVDSTAFIGFRALQLNPLWVRPAAAAGGTGTAGWSSYSQGCSSRWTTWPTTTTRWR